MAKLDKLLGQAQEHLEPGEEVLGAVQGTYEVSSWGEDTTRAAILVATDRRMFLYSKKLRGHDLLTFPYTDISSFESKTRFRIQTIVFAIGEGWKSKQHKLKSVGPEGLPEFAAAVESRVAGGAE
jgi:hypothetical protein